MDFAWDDGLGGRVICGSRLADGASSGMTVTVSQASDVGCGGGAYDVCETGDRQPFATTSVSFLQWC